MASQDGVLGIHACIDMYQRISNNDALNECEMYSRHVRITSTRPLELDLHDTMQRYFHLMLAKTFTRSSRRASPTRGNGKLLASIFNFGLSI